MTSEKWSIPNWKKNPFKGPRSYEEEDRSIFFGRSREVDDITKLISQNSVLIIYGKTGIGKSSIIKAGLQPAVKNNDYLPVYIPPFYHEETKDLRVYIYERLQVAVEEVNQQLQKESSSIYAGLEKLSLTPFKGQTLWEYFLQAPLKGKVKESEEEQELSCILIFDQFEEIFTKGSRGFGKFLSNIEELMNELSGLVENYNIREDEDDDLYYEYQDSKPLCKVVLSFREEYLPEFDVFEEKIPSLFLSGSRYRVNPLTRENALQIVENAGKRAFNPEARQQIVQLVARQEDQTGTRGIEPFLLSILCYQEYERFLQRNKDLSATDEPRKLEKEDIGEQRVEQVIRDYYQQSTKGCDYETIRFVEENLLSEQGVRTVYPLDDALQRHRANENSIVKLEEAKLLRRLHLGLENYLEITHDRLAGVIGENREHHRKAEESKKKRSRLLATSFLTFIVTLVFGAFLMTWLNREETARHRNKLQAKLLYIKTLDFIQEVKAEPIFNQRKSEKIVHALLQKAKSLDPSLEVDSNTLLKSHIRFYPFSEDNWTIPTRTIYFTKNSPDGNYMVIASEEDKVYFLNTRNGNLTSRPFPGKMEDVFFKEDSIPVILASMGMDSQLELRTLDGEVIKTWNISGWYYKNLSVRFSPDGGSFLLSGDDQPAALYDITQDSIDYYGDEDDIYYATYFSPNLILTASYEGVLDIWDYNRKSYSSMQVLPSISSRMNEYKKYFDSFEKGNIDYNFFKEMYRISEIMIFSDYIFFYTDFSLSIWDADKNKSLRNLGFLAYSDHLSFAMFDNNNKIILGLKDGRVLKWDWQSEEEGFISFKDSENIKNLYDFSGPLSALSISDSSGAILAASGSSFVKLNKAGDVVPSENHTGVINDLNFSSDNKYLVTASEDGTARVWDRKQGAQLSILSGHKGAVLQAEFMNNDQCIITRSLDATVKTWDFNGNNLKTIQKPGHKIDLIKISPQGGRFATLTKDGILNIWDTDGMEVSGNVNDMDSVKSFEFSEDGSRMLILTENKNMHLHDVNNNQNLIRKEDSIYYAVFNYRGGITALSNGVFKYWDKNGIAQTSGEPSFIPIPSGSGEVYIWGAGPKILASIDGASIRWVNDTLVGAIERGRLKIQSIKTLDEDSVHLSEFSTIDGYDDITAFAFSHDKKKIAFANNNFVVMTDLVQKNLEEILQERDFITDLKKDSVAYRRYQEIMEGVSMME